jgi:anti-sigma factor RsiW
MNAPIRHATDDQLQDWLDGRLSREQLTRLEAHLDACPACRGEAETWRALVAELSSLPALEPRPGFSGRVLDGVGRSPEPRLSLAARVRGLVASWRRPDSATHPTPTALQDLLDGALAGRSARLVRSHLAACASCRDEARSWDAVLRGVAAMPRYAPSAGFADAVMARVQVAQAAPARVALVRRALDRVRALAGPQRRRAWAAAAGIALAPTVTAALVAYVVFSHPLVTVGTLASFLWIKGGAALGALASGLGTTVVQSAPLFGAWSTIGSLALSPTAAGASLLGFSALTLTSAWVLYRNVFTPAYGRSA